MVVTTAKTDDVFGAVWLATAALTFERCSASPSFPASEVELSFGQSEIQEVAQQLCTKTVHNARISQWVNADHADSAYAYLRAVGRRRRLAAVQEVSPRAALPAALLPDDANVMQFRERIVTFSELRAWVIGPYSEHVVTALPPRAIDASAVATGTPRRATAAALPGVEITNLASDPGELAPNERLGVVDIAASIAKLKAFLDEEPVPSSADAIGLLAYTLRIKEIQGNLSNDISLVAGILARHYLVTHERAVAYDSATKAQGAAGPDIEALTDDGSRLIGEIKTTVAYGQSDLGARQRSSFLEDFAKLKAADAQRRFFFLVDRRTFEIVRTKYSGYLPGITVVFLPSGDHFTPLATAPVTDS